ncbi:hypothetical protein VP01_142g4 [Puccinia sorghi]|uniref:Uncharacterized protein n=1 Tax=Puccinia sorghi TaxID=27349 RepID=A0A0L6VKL4_9BASI|nr:hypothetical protein VP01_142g4 [Puccinia sorghi]
MVEGSFINLSCPFIVGQRLLSILSILLWRKSTFYLAEEVCSSVRGSLKPRTIEKCVSSNFWLKDKYQDHFIRPKKLSTLMLKFLKNKRSNLFVDTVM